MTIYDGKIYADGVDPGVLKAEDAVREIPFGCGNLPILNYGFVSDTFDICQAQIEAIIDGQRFSIPVGPVSYIQLENTLPIPGSNNIKDGYKRGVKTIVSIVRYG